MYDGNMYERVTLDRREEDATASDVDLKLGEKYTIQNSSENTVDYLNVLN